MLTLLHPSPILLRAPRERLTLRRDSPRVLLEPSLELGEFSHRALVLGDYVSLFIFALAADILARVKLGVELARALIESFGVAVDHALSSFDGVFASSDVLRLGGEFIGGDCDFIFAFANRSLAFAQRILPAPYPLQLHRHLARGPREPLVFLSFLCRFPAFDRAAFFGVRDARLDVFQTLFELGHVRYVVLVQGAFERGVLDVERVLNVGEPFLLAGLNADV